MSTARPAGRDEVTEALLQAAADLFAERGPAAVSTREIARRAHVNHGLVHRHFGTKDALVRAVIDRLLLDARERFAGDGGEALAPIELLTAVASDDRYWKVLARALLDGHAGELLRGRFPLARSAVERLRRTQRAGEIDADLDPRELVASGLALLLGWLLFEPFLAAAVGLDRLSPATLRRRVFALWQR
ncbi:MAG: helix-turn-helix domain-containing protein, partial [Myxococcota bacterium]